ncbi:MAG: DUF2946 family protein [Planctomycetota bacterium]
MMAARTQQTRTARLTALAAALALCLRLLLPLLHGGAGCEHHVFVGSSGVAYETCSCGVIHTDDGDVRPHGGHEEGEPSHDSACLACQLEDQSPGGDPLVVVGLASALPARPQLRALDAPLLVAARCPRPPSRAPPAVTV